MRAGTASGTGTGYLTTPTLAVGADAADRRALADLRHAQQACGLTVEPLTVREARGREPLLSPGISCAFDIPADHQVDPQTAGRPARRTARRRGPQPAASGRRAAGLLWEDGRVAGVRLTGGGSVRAAETVVANGLGAAALDGLPAGTGAAAAPGLRRHPPAPCARAPAAAADGHCARHGPRGAGVHRAPAGRHGGDWCHPARGRPGRSARRVRRRHLPAAPRRAAAGARRGGTGAARGHGAGPARHAGQRPAAGPGRRAGRRGRAGAHHRHRFLPARRPADPRRRGRLPAAHGRGTDPRWAEFRPTVFPASQVRPGTVHNKEAA